MADYYDAQILRALNEILTELRKLTAEPVKIPPPARMVSDPTLTGQEATVQKITERAYGKSAES